MSAKATLLRDMVPCEIKHRNGTKYITIDGADVVAADCGRKNCAAHPGCKKPLYYKLVDCLNGEYILRAECPNMIFGYAIHADFLEKNKVQVSLDRWC